MNISFWFTQLTEFWNRGSPQPGPVPKGYFTCRLPQVSLQAHPAAEGTKIRQQRDSKRTCRDSKARSIFCFAMAGEEQDSKIKIGRASKSTNTVGLDLPRENLLYGRELIGKRREGQWLRNRPAPSSFCGLKEASLDVRGRLYYCRSW